LLPAPQHLLLGTQQRHPVGQLQPRRPRTPVVSTRHRSPSVGNAPASGLVNARTNDDAHLPTGPRPSRLPVSPVQVRGLPRARTHTAANTHSSQFATEPEYARKGPRPWEPAVSAGDVGRGRWRRRAGRGLRGPGRGRRRGRGGRSARASAWRRGGSGPRASEGVGASFGVVGQRRVP